MKKLRRHGIAEVTAANAFLAAEYWAAHNRRFAVPPASPDDFHRAVPPRLSLAQVFRLEEPRTVSNDWACAMPIATCSWSGRVRCRQRAAPSRCSRMPPGRSRFATAIAACAGLKLRCRCTGHGSGWRSPPTATPAAPAPVRRTRQSVDHLWRTQVVTDYHAYLQLAKQRRAWGRGQP